jgi:hypothetical protein
VFHLFLRLAVGLAVLFTALVGLIRARPYDDTTIRAFIEPPEGCAVPCWQNIRPGTTSADHAMRLLRANPRIETVGYDFNFSRADGWLFWRWSGRQPDELIAPANNTVRVDYNTVTSILMATRIRFGDLWLALGAPDDMRQMQFGDRLYVENVYLDESFLVQVQLPCAASSDDLWLAPVNVLWVKGIPSTYTSTVWSQSDLTHCEGPGIR